MTETTELYAYLLLVLAGFLPNEVWRVLGLVVGRASTKNPSCSYGRGR